MSEPDIQTFKEMLAERDALKAERGEWADSLAAAMGRAQDAEAQAQAAYRVFQEEIGAWKRHHTVCESIKVERDALAAKVAELTQALGFADVLTTEDNIRIAAAEAKAATLTKAASALIFAWDNRWGEQGRDKMEALRSALAATGGTYAIP